jgi:hypothetical protein
MEKELTRKTRIYAQGCSKRGRLEEAGRVWEMARRSLGLGKACENGA